MKILLDSGKGFYKAALHGHSTHSDGRLSPAELKPLYKEKGYSVVAFTDHEHLIDNSYLDDEDFLTITSCEIAIKQFPNESTLKNLKMKVCHLNFYALDQHNTVTPCYSSVYDHFWCEENKHLIQFDGEYERTYGTEGISEIIEIAHKNGFLVSYNHPFWSLENATDYLGYKGLDFVEIYNNGVDMAGGESYCANVFDDFLRAGHRLFATMTDDSHSKGDMFGGWVMINAERLDYGSIMNALAKGDFYASQGPEIHSLTIDGDTVKIKSSNAAKICCSTAGRRTSARTDTDYAEFKILPDDRYFRITVIDESGRHATTQSYEV